MSRCLNLSGLSPTLKDELMERTPALVSDTSHFKSSYASLYQQEAGDPSSHGAEEPWSGDGKGMEL